MWTIEKYRCDGKWSPNRAAVRLIAYKNIDFGNEDTALHQPCYPMGINISNKFNVFLPLIHMAYLRPSDRKRRYDFYTKAVIDNKTAYKHAKSILEVKPKLKSLYNPYEKLMDKFFHIYENPLNEVALHYLL